MTPIARDEVGRVPVDVRDVPEGHRYEARVDGRVLGVALYREHDGARDFVHTEVAPEAEGMGAGSALVRAALEDVRARGLAVVPRCPFVGAFIRRHGDFAGLVRARDAGLLPPADGR